MVEDLYLSLSFLPSFPLSVVGMLTTIVVATSNQPSHPATGKASERRPRPPGPWTEERDTKIGRGDSGGGGEEIL